MVSLFNKVCRTLICKNALNKCVENNVQLGFVNLFHTTEKQNGIRAKWRAPTSIQMKKRVEILKEKGAYPVTQRSKFLDWNHNAELYAFSKRLNEDFNSALLLEAFTDPSYIPKEIERLKDVEVDQLLDMKSNAKLADAGRALIEDFVIKHLRAVNPALPEEGIRSLVDYLISDEVLCRIAQGLGFRDLILLEPFPPTEKVFAQCFSAVVGCLNLSSGLERCHLFIRDFVVVQLIGKDVWDIWKVEDPVKLLNTLFASSGQEEPEPRLMGDLGRNTIESVYQVGLFDENKQLIGKGYGETVDIAIKVSAYDALGRLFGQSVDRSPMPFHLAESCTFSKADPNPSIKEWKVSYGENQ